MPAVVEPVWLHLGVTGPVVVGEAVELSRALEHLHVMDQGLVACCDHWLVLQSPRRRGHTESPALGPAGSPGQSIWDLVPVSATGWGGKAALGMMHRELSPHILVIAELSTWVLQRGNNMFLEPKEHLGQFWKYLISWLSSEQLRAHQNPQRASSSILSLGSAEDLGLFCEDLVLYQLCRAEVALGMLLFPTERPGCVVVLVSLSLQLLGFVSIQQLLGAWGGGFGVERVTQALRNISG